MVSRLDITVRRLTSDPVAGWAEAVLLVDGEDVLRRIWGEGIGRNPDDVLGQDSPLLPDQPHEAPLLRCGCGEEGCGALIARISPDGQEVAWSDFRDGSAQKSDRLSTVFDRFHGQVLDVPEIRFDRSQYIAELRRADSEREWESPDERTARRVRELLRAQRNQLNRTGWQLVRAWPNVTDRSVPDRYRSVPGVTVSLRNGERQITLEYPLDVSDPDRDAHAVVNAILSTEPNGWPVGFRGGQLSAWQTNPNL